MPQDTGRNSFELDGFRLSKVDNYEILKNFDCDDADLNDYFTNDIIKYRDELLSQAYKVEGATEDGEFVLVALIDFGNDAVRYEKWKKCEISLSDDKTISLPAVKITRFGVHKELQGNNFGTHIINMVKYLFLTDNRTGCRLITVDAYNDKPALNFYTKNEFEFFSDKDINKKTRSMFFDLKRLYLR